MTTVNPAQLQRNCSWSMARHRRWAEEDVSLPHRQAQDTSLALSITTCSCHTAVSHPQMDWSEGAPPPPSQHPSPLGGQGELLLP